MKILSGLCLILTCYDKYVIIMTNMSYKKVTMKNGFTLAEVLITLGIIGVVAALTIPTLIHNYRIKALKTDLKKNYSMINQAILRAKADNDIFNFYKYCTSFDSSSGFYNKKSCQKMIYDAFKINSKDCKYTTSPQNYALNNIAYIDVGATYHPEKRLENGSCINVQINAHTMGITVDINGSNTGPNALGHDIFSFILDKNDVFQPAKTSKVYTEEELSAYRASKNISEEALLSSDIGRTAGYQQMGTPCSKYDNRKGNGGGCSWYAMNDICPDDSTKGYWECLPVK